MTRVPTGMMKFRQIIINYKLVLKAVASPKSASYIANLKHQEQFKKKKEFKEDMTYIQNNNIDRVTFAHCGANKWDRVNSQDTNKANKVLLKQLFSAFIVLILMALLVVWIMN